MRKRYFGDRLTSVIGLGTADFGGKCPESRGREILDTYWKQGGNFIDTARVYGDFVTPRNGESEKVVGRWIHDRHCREQVFLSTKGGHPRLSSMHIPRLSREEVRGDLEDSLQDLGTDYVDIFWLHRDDETRPVGDIMETLHSLKEDGLTRLVGVSNWRTDRIEAANSYASAHGLTPIFANQVQFSLARQRAFQDPTLITMDQAMYQMHERTGMTCCCFSSQARGFFLKLERDGIYDLPQGLMQEYLCPENLAIYERLKKMQASLKKPVEVLSLAFLTSQPFPTFPLVGASRPEQLMKLLAASELILTQRQCRYLRKL